MIGASAKTADRDRHSVKYLMGVQTIDARGVSGGSLASGQLSNANEYFSLLVNLIKLCLESVRIKQHFS
jgi:hypothetical protein